MTIANRLHVLEGRLPRQDRGPYVVEVQPGETETQAIERAAPKRGFVIVPAVSTSMEAWVAEAAKVLGP